VERGFALIEIIVAFAVATIMLVALYSLLSRGASAGAAAEAYGTAAEIAESSLDALVPDPALDAGEAREQLAGGFERRVVVRPRPDLLPNESGPLVAAEPQGAMSQPAIFPYEIEVDVSWRSGGATRSLRLTTIRLGPPP
jgi:general secretion pathway protein I